MFYGAAESAEGQNPEAGTAIDVDFEDITELSGGSIEIR